MEVTYRRSQGIESSAMKSESLLFDPETNKFCLLNETATFLWERLETPATVAELAEGLCGAFDGVESAEARRHVEELLQRLRGLALIESE